MTETLAARAVEAKFVADGDGIFAGYAAVFGTEPDAQGDVIAPGAFARSLAEHKAAGTWPLMLWQHDITEPIGVWLDLREDSAGLAVKGKLVLDAARGREAHALLKARALDGLSIGYRVRGFTRRPGGRLLSDLELIEISLVSLPAGARARITDVKSAASAVQPQEKTMDDEDGKGVGGTAEAAIEARIVALEASVAGIDTRLAGAEEKVGAVKSAAQRIEARLNRPGTAVETKAAPEKIEAKAFEIFVRRGREAPGPDEVKALTVSTDSGGGYLAPESFTAELLKNLVLFSPIRAAARVAQTAQGSVILPRRTGTLTAGWVGESETRPATEPTYGQLELPVCEIACYVDVLNRLLEDAAFDMDAELSRDFAEEFGRCEAGGFIGGTGAKQPVGLLNAGITAIVSGDANGLPSTNPADVILDLYHALPGAYAANAAWGMLGAVRKLKASDGHYLLAEPLAAGQPATILGRPVIEMPDLPDVEANAYPTVFGDFAAGFRIFDRVALSVLRDPYTQQTAGLVRFHARRRVAAGVVKSEAFRLLKIAA